jgi:hypothetical protein
MNVDEPDMNEVGPEKNEQEIPELHEAARNTCDANGLDSTGTTNMMLDRLQRLEKAGRFGRQRFHRSFEKDMISFFSQIT